MWSFYRTPNLYIASKFIDKMHSFSMNTSFVVEKQHFRIVLQTAWLVPFYEIVVVLPEKTAQCIH